jgi:hypothetical protein
MKNEPNIGTGGKGRIASLCHAEHPWPALAQAPFGSRWRLSLAPNR